MRYIVQVLDAGTWHDVYYTASIERAEYVANAHRDAEREVRVWDAELQRVIEEVIVSSN